MSENKKNIIHINRKKLSKIEVKEKQKFGEILQNHHQITKRPIYKQKRYYIILFILVVIAYIIYLEEKESAKPEKIKVESTK
jgi:hypothetical protein